MPQIDEESRDINILEHIRRYCRECSEALEALAPSQQEFSSNRICQNSVAMCILQTGELVKHLSFGFTDGHPEIPWHSISRARDIFAHHYIKLDPDTLYETATTDMPMLLGFCNNILGSIEVDKKAEQL